jgi:hypothetical protein
MINRPQLWMNLRLTDTEWGTQIKTIVNINGYSAEFIDRIHKKYKNKKELRNLMTLIPVLKRDDAPTKRHHVLPGHHKQTTKDFPEP